MILNSPYISGSLTVTGNTTIQGQLTVTGSLSGTASLASNALLLQGTGSTGFATTSSLLAVSSSQQQISASLLSLTASYNALSSSYTSLSASYNVASSSFSTRITSDSSSLSSRTTQIENVYATTGSNSFTGVQNFSNTCTPNSFTAGASLYTAGGLRVTQDAYFSSSVYIKGNVTVYGTQSVAYISSSQLDIGTNIITVNTATPSIRYGGLSVFDSGSTGLTGSIFWDSELNRWIYSNASGSGGGATYGGGMFISGPRNSQGIGCEQGTTACMLLVGQGGDHLTSSLVYHDSTKTCFYGNSLIVSGSGNVGIGTNPSFPLHIYSLNQNVASNLATAYSNAKFRLETYNTSGQGISMGSIGGYSQYIQAQYSDCNTMNPLLLQPFSGSVGIGMSTAPTVALHVYSTGSSSSNITAEFWNGDYTTGARNFIRLRNAATVGSTTSAYFGQGQDQKTYFYNNDFSRPGDIVITNTGKVGINRSDSNYNLDISDNTGGTLNISNRNSSATVNKCSTLIFSGYDTICGEKLSGAIVGESINANYGSGHLKFLVSTGNIYAVCQLTEAMRITSNAYVGIGITSACKHLEVGGTIRTTVSPSVYYRDMTYLGDTYQFGSSETSDNVDFRICGGSTWSSGGNFRWSTQPGNSTPIERMRITSGGSIGIAATNPRTQLDIGDIHDGIGGTTFCSFLVAQGVWATFACITDNDANVITDITYVNNNDSNRSGALLARWAYNGTCVGTYIVNCAWNWSQNINQFGIRNNGGALQICLGGGANGYRVQARTQGSRATG